MEAGILPTCSPKIIFKLAVITWTLLMKDVNCLKYTKNNPQSDVLKLILSTGRFNTPKCLWVVIGNEFPLDLEDLLDGYFKPIITMENNENSLSLIDFINKNTGIVTSYACITYMIIDQISPKLLDLMADNINKAMVRYFISKAKDNLEAQNFLLNPVLEDEENVVAIFPVDSTEKSWSILNRKIIGANGKPEVSLVTTWSISKGFKKSDQSIFPKQLDNFYGKEIKGTTMKFKPFSNFDINSPDSIGVTLTDSLDYYILRVIAETLNFTYTISMSTDGLWGYLKEDVS